MPATRGEKKRREQYLHSPPAPAMSQSHVSFSVWSRFATSPTPIPLAHQQQFENALTTLHPVWRDHQRQRNLSVAASALPTGAYGQEACFTLNPPKETRVGIPLGPSLERLRKWKAQSGTQKKVAFDIKNQSPESRHL